MSNGSDRALDFFFQGLTMPMSYMFLKVYNNLSETISIVFVCSSSY